VIFGSERSKSMLPKEGCGITTFWKWSRNIWNYWTTNSSRLFVDINTWRFTACYFFISVKSLFMTESLFIMSISEKHFRFSFRKRVKKYSTKLRLSILSFYSEWIAEDKLS
jgi:hypothetical protein